MPLVPCPDCTHSENPGRCRHCRGTGINLDVISGIFTAPAATMADISDECVWCGGDGQCKTCGGQLKIREVPTHEESPSEAGQYEKLEPKPHEREALFNADSAPAGLGAAVGGGAVGGAAGVFAGGGKYFAYVFVMFIIAIFAETCDPNRGKPYKPTTLPTGITSGPSGTSLYTGTGDPLAFQAYNDGNYFLKQSKYDQAISYLSEAIRRAPNYAEAYSSRGIVYTKIGRDALAFQDYDSAVRLQPNNPQALYNRGLIEHRLGRQEEAASDITQALRLNPTESRDAYYRVRGNAYLMLNQPQQALADFNETLRLKPDDVESLGKRGQAYSRLGDNDRALRDYNNALDLDSSNALLYWARAVVFGRLNRYEEAVADLDASIKLSPNEPRTFDSRGLAYGHLGQHDRAVVDFTRAINMNPDFASAYLNRGTAYEALGSFGLAIQDYDQALRMDPTLTQALTARERVRVRVSGLR